MMNLSMREKLLTDLMDFLQSAPDSEEGAPNGVPTDESTELAGLEGESEPSLEGADSEKSISPEEIARVLGKV